MAAGTGGRKAESAEAIRVEAEKAARRKAWKIAGFRPRQHLMLPTKKGVFHMKKFLALLMILTLAVNACAMAEEAAATVYVTISDDTGALVLAREAVAVTDLDTDGALTINDALIAAHAAHHADGAAGYESASSEYGLSLYRLWGVDNGGSYGYCLNQASAWSLLDPVAEGDHVQAYVYTDLMTWSDTYSYFATGTMEAAAGTEITLQLNAAGYDEAWNPVTLPVAGATLTVNGQPTAAVTDDSGCAALILDESGVYVISAVSDTMTLVPPVCIVTVTAAESN